MNQLIACILLLLRKECQKWPNLLLIIVYEWLNEVVMYIYLHSWVYSAKRKNRPMHFSYGINNTHFDLIKKNYFTGFCSVTNLDLHFVDMNRYASLQRSLVTHLNTVTKTWWQTHSRTDPQTWSLLCYLCVRMNDELAFTLILLSVFNNNY